MKWLTPIESKNNVCKIDVDKVRLRAILETSPDPIIITDLKGTIVDCNDVAAKTLGLLKEEFDK